MSNFPPDFKPSMDDKVLSMCLISSSDTDLTYQRPDGTVYVLEIRNKQDDFYYTPETQLNIKFNEYIATIDNKILPSLDGLHYCNEWWY